MRVYTHANSVNLFCKMIKDKNVSVPDIIFKICKVCTLICKIVYALKVSKVILVHCCVKNAKHHILFDLHTKIYTLVLKLHVLEFLVLIWLKYHYILAYVVLKHHGHLYLPGDIYIDR